MEKRIYNAGIDFLRIFAMFMIVVTHVLGKGGVRDSVAGTVDVHFLQTWIIQASVYVAVNCYALISGYVGFRSSFKYSKVVNLWLQVAFYSIGITLFFLILGKDIGSNDWLAAFFPVITGQYWYVTAAATLILKYTVSEKWYWYTSPTISLGALALFILFVNLKIAPAGRLVSFIKFFAPATFGVYLVHLHPLVVKFAMRDFAENFVNQSPLVFPFTILGVSLLIFFGSILIEKVRIWLFKTLQVSRLTTKIDDWLIFKNKVKKI
ncbi:acyltransferase family protein [Streptococcus pluranimalium]|uniref:acyltransferase family protein n=1 Tax=Streptococcus pluranimalium TaxID=82348 RepID=UPI004046D9D5